MGAAVELQMGSYPECENGGRKVEEKDVNDDHVQDPSDLGAVADNEMQS